AHRYPAIAPAQTIEGVRMLSEPDVAAMKLNAIRNRGAKKDYWDLAELLSDYGIDELVGYYALKYSQENLWSLTRSILYFDDAEEEPDPRDLKGRTWDEVKALIRSRVRL
ncbi:MAG TPA: nucleotidyl transferase AbiEii/AbiGii toxin family protein, partial [Bacteroidia bacterium]|nr:nucleotidyl transferase AbiEii/AbiGii toxin family protein [Bacteroidia bacterium]